ncbi:hypothetical protein BOTCAL_0005g00250 [Botryotinia calthae]|uniref:Uncharacterized protein n=1 Tax=Botryotinia calthae TaxID=38488 RepID=A0A4Y8DHL8_9HELO|nr:hypothetical protein BOTCAL_0005g00250 [Botryotinia calthae]
MLHFNELSHVKLGSRGDGSGDGEFSNTLESRRRNLCCHPRSDSRDNPSTMLYGTQKLTMVKFMA